MTRTLTELASSFLRDKDRFRASIKFPVLIWSAPPSTAMTEGLQCTNSGVGAATRPQEGEALVFDVAKDLAKKNPFAMWITVGRTETNDIVLDDGSVSRFHASIQLESNGLVLRDAESKNGTFLEGTRIEPNQKVLLQDKSKLKFGGVEVTFLGVEGLFAMMEELMSP